MYVIGNHRTYYVKMNMFLLQSKAIEGLSDRTNNNISDYVLLDFLVTVKAAPHECVIRTSLPKT